MKLLLFSDNHRNHEIIKQVMKKHPNMDHYISLGDSEMKKEALINLGVYGVRGNYPFEPKFPKTLELNLEGWSIFLTHGHLYQVKMGLSRLLNQGVYLKKDLVCFGHTHKPFLKEIEGVILLNPGALKQSMFGVEPTYATIDLTKKTMDIKIHTIQGKILHTWKKTR